MATLGNSDDKILLFNNTDLLKSSWMLFWKNMLKKNLYNKIELINKVKYFTMEIK